MVTSGHRSARPLIAFRGRPDRPPEIYVMPITTGERREQGPTRPIRNSTTRTAFLDGDKIIYGHSAGCESSLGHSRCSRLTDGHRMQASDTGRPRGEGRPCRDVRRGGTPGPRLRRQLLLDRDVSEVFTDERRRHECAGSLTSRLRQQLDPLSPDGRAIHLSVRRSADHLRHADIGR